jgi:ABC-type glycerol-3-phosphate transport system substrate-binding protein
LIVPLFAVLVIGLAVAGCGSSDDSTTGSTDGGETSTASITKPELIKQGDEICAASNEAIEEQAEEFAEENGVDTENPTTEQQEEVVTEVVAPEIAAQAEEIAALGAPSGDEDEVAAIVSAVETAAEEVEEDPSLIVGGEGAGPFQEANELATEYGFKVCGEE